MRLIRSAVGPAIPRSRYKIQIFRENSRHSNSSSRELSKWRFQSLSRQDRRIIVKLESVTDFIRISPYQSRYRAHNYFATALRMECKPQCQGVVDRYVSLEGLASASSLIWPDKEQRGPIGNYSAALNVPFVSYCPPRVGSLIIR